MISLTKLRALTLADAGSAPSHLSAASGLACVGSSIYVVADDELHLGIFPAESDAPGRLLRLFPGSLPPEKDARKRQKPDLEAITVLPPFGRYTGGALLAFGSGSTPDRRLGALLAVDAQGSIAGSPQVIDLSQLFSVLERHFPALNIEGATTGGGTLRLLQRGNNRHPQNAIVRFSLAALLDALSSGAPVGPLAPDAVDTVELGQIGGVPLCFTDGAALPDGGMVFTAIAEDTADTYNDGPCLGAAIGLADKDGRICFVEHLDLPHKIEGVDARVDGDAISLLLVTDADDAVVPACLFSATIPNQRTHPNQRTCPYKGP